MKITGLELFHISIPFAKPYKLSKVYGTRYDAEAVILKVHTDQGIVGLGEADPLNPFSEETPATVMVVTRDQLAPQLMGQNPTHITAIESNLDVMVHGNLLARGAVNMALFDIVGKANGIPAHMLLGGLYQSKLPLLAGIGSGTPEEDAASIRQQIEDGYKTVMIKMGALPIADEIKRMTSAKAQFGDQMKIIVDANQGWTVAETLEFIDGIRGSRLDLLEQPIERDDTDGLKNIRNRVRCPLSADESVGSIREAQHQSLQKRWVEQGKKDCGNGPCFRAEDFNEQHVGIRHHPGGLVAAWLYAAEPVGYGTRIYVRAQNVG